MSRPSSRLSSSSLRDHAATGHQVRASSSSSAIMAIPNSMAPFTPGPVPRSSTSNAGGAGGRSSRLGLSAKQQDRLSETIASVQRGARGGDGDGDTVIMNGQRHGVAKDARNGRDRVNHAETRDRKGKAKASMAPNASFIAEASFIDAPLNSRINNTRQASSPRRTAVLPREYAQKLLTSTRLRQIISGNDDVEDDEADLQQYTEDEAVPEEEAIDMGDDLIEADLAIQEALLIEDLLSVLLGIQGHVITIDPEYNPEDEIERLQGVRFVIDEQIDPSLHDLAARIIPLATHYTSISSFLDMYQHTSFGLTSHALCSGIRSILSEYLTLIAQLEEQFNSSPSFSLQRFYVFIQPVLHKLFLVQALVEDITGTQADGDASTEDVDGEAGQKDDESEDDDRFGGGAALREAMKAMGTGDTQDKAKGWADGGPVKGGEILAIIDERLQRTSGDPVASSVYSMLLLKASQPYAQTLLKWISTGQLSDPYDEFMIRESKNVDRTSLDQDYVDEYWERKYTLRDSTVAAASGPLFGGSGDNEMGGLGDFGLAGTAATNLDAGMPEKRAVKRDSGLGGGAIIPTFLERWKTKILMAGKYLNVIRECGTSELKEIMQAQASQVAGSEDDGQGDIALDSDSFTARIDSAYLSANTALLRLLVQQQDLFPRLRSLKHHFFLDQGDSFTHFLDLAHTELAKKAKSVNLSKLQSFLDLAIRNPSSASGGDPYKEDVKVVTSEANLTDWLVKVMSVKGASLGHEQAPSSASEPGFALSDAGSVNNLAKEASKKKDDKNMMLGIDALSLDYTVKFPLSLVISRKTILRYQLLFRHLLSLKHLEQLLTALWSDHTRNPAWRRRSSHPGLERWKNRVFTLRARMLAFIQQMFAFAVSEVIEGNWRKLMMKLESVATVDGLLQYHTDFLDTCMKECMLTSPDLLKTHAKLMTTVSLFAQHKAKFANAAARITRATEEAIERGEDWQSVSVASEETSMRKFEDYFYRHQRMMMDRVQYSAFSDSNALLALLVRLASTIPAKDGGLL